MAKSIDLHDPNFVLFPINNNRTAWRPFGLPVVLVVPHCRNPAGTPITDSDVFDVRIYIEKVPREARVAGHQHIDMRFPDRELYARTLDALELAERRIDLRVQDIRRSDGTSVGYAQAQTGDMIHYTTRNGVHSTIMFISGANYYDLSDITIDVELLPSDRYNLVYEAQYFKRLISADGRSDFLCIDVNSRSLALFKFSIDHPGKVLDEFYRLTPSVYLTNANKASDTTVALYRPFTDMLQDVMDEQDLLERVNWVFETPPEAIPYLSSLLGWDIPYFPQSLDQLRRAVLRRTVEFQNLKGSRRAIINIFRLFGFEILISNLWWSADGKRLIRPDERLPSDYRNQEITTVGYNQVDLILDDYGTSGFTTTSIPLLFRPQEKTGLDKFTALRDGGEITILAYMVTVGSPAHDVLRRIAADIKHAPATYGNDKAGVVWENGFPHPRLIHDAVIGLQLDGYSQIHIAGKMGDPVDELLVGPAVPLLKHGVRFDRETNLLHLTLNGHIEFDNHRLFVFAVYRRYEFRVPDVLANLQSNRFDIQVLTQDLEEFADPTTLEFAIEFLYRLKAFHSLLHAIRTRIELTETYEVTDLWVGGDSAQRLDTDIGRLQVPPAIIPNIPSESDDCSVLDYRNLGYKSSDIVFRLRKLANLPEEHAAWRALDSRALAPGTEAPITRLSPTLPAEGRTSCKFTHIGQDRITLQGRVELRDTERGPGPDANQGDYGYANTPALSPLNRRDSADEATTNSDSGIFGSFTREYTQIRQPVCELDGITDYCYKGRVDDELLYRPTILGQETIILRSCGLSLGTGVYWLYPARSQPVRPGVRKPCRHSRTGRLKFSGGAPESGIYYYRNDHQDAYMSAPYNTPLLPRQDSLLGRLYRDLDTPTTQTIHYSNRLLGVHDDPDARRSDGYRIWESFIAATRQLALQRPSLEICKPTLHLPGCRFLCLNALKEDFTHDVWKARPWDEHPCGPKHICPGSEPRYLNVRKVTDTDGNERLVFDDEPYRIMGNGLEPDIPSLGDHTLQDDNHIRADDVIHKVYMKDADSKPFVSFEAVCDYDDRVSDDGTIEVDEPLFSSYVECPTGSIRDFADGYACLSGYLPYRGQEPGIYDQVMEGLGLTMSMTNATSSVLFLLSSGIRHESGIRLDCGCLTVDCDNAEIPSCDAMLFRDRYGHYDWNHDHLAMMSHLVQREDMTIRHICLDGSIQSLLETI